jgi:exonuclease III
VERLKTMLPEYRTVEFAVSTAKKGYSGVAILARAPIDSSKSKPQGTLLGFVNRAPDAPTPSAADPGHVKLLSVKEGMCDFKSLDGSACYASEYTDEGRVLTLEFDAFNLVLTYVPNSGQKLERLDYRLHDWDVDFRAYLAHLGKRTGKPVIVGGDL